MNTGRERPGIVDVPQAAVDAFRGPPPWSAMLPVAAGVFLGALVFGLFALAYLHAQTRQTASFAGVSAIASTSLQAGAGGALEDGGAAKAAALPRIPGMVEASRRKLRSACIAGTVGHRRSNGWVQAMDDDEPRRCVATTQ